MFQMVWVWTVSLPVTILNSPNVSYGPEGGGSSYFNATTDIIGVVLFAIGFAIEAVADIQKVTLPIIPRTIMSPFLLFIGWNCSFCGQRVMVVSIQKQQ